MRKRKNDNRTLDKVGKHNYNFDFYIEKNIYAYLCCRHVKKKILKKMSENIKMDSYMEWKQYIYNKCAEFPDEKIVEFRRYLNQRLRNVKPSREYWSLVIPIILTLIITKFPEMLEDMQKIDLSGEQVSVIVVFLILVFIMMIPIIYGIWCMVSPIWDNQNDENFLVDYMEIIDYMIEERKKNKENCTNHQ